NDIRRTNVPNIRIAYRYEALCEELRLLGIAYKDRQEELLKNVDCGHTQSSQSPSDRRKLEECLLIFCHP
ncbi:unnamed protein product, partial [Didymodactylos carnosus]